MEKIFLYLRGYTYPEFLVGIQFSDTHNRLTIGAHKRLRGEIINFIHKIIHKKAKYIGKISSGVTYKAVIENFDHHAMSRLVAKLNQKRKYGYDYEFTMHLGLVFGIYPKKKLYK